MRFLVNTSGSRGLALGNYQQTGRREKTQHGAFGIEHNLVIVKKNDKSEHYRGMPFQMTANAFIDDN